MKEGSKAKQIYHISVFKTFMHSYIANEIQIYALLLPKAKQFLELLMSNKTGDGIRVSALLALFVPPHYHIIAKDMVKS